MSSTMFRYYLFIKYSERLRTMFYFYLILFYQNKLTKAPTVASSQPFSLLCQPSSLSVSGVISVSMVTCTKFEENVASKQVKIAAVLLADIYKTCSTHFNH